MDPAAIWRTLVELVEELNDQPDAEEAAAKWAALLASALDLEEWLGKGGFTPWGGHP